MAAGAEPFDAQPFDAGSFNPDDPAVRRRIRQRRRRRVWLAVAVVVLGAVGGFVFGLVSGPPHRQATEPPQWAGTLGTSLLLLGLAFEAVGLVYGFRSGQIQRGWKSPVRAFPFRQRRRMVKQVRGKLPVAAEELPLLRLVAEGLRGQRWLIFLIAALMVIMVGSALSRYSPGWFILAAVYVVAMSAGIVSYLRVARAAERFLREHGENGTDSVA
ncbi:hypothetical protein [Planosporangium mesophilum]|uniref:Uncharacterized protein n=1 Tax=Planosporangium mesophilum TaxID=689768 RepID=A0A8J3TEG2_9ACTN|nr:hypothetical protein [Planosporangium mesophilum]NJC84357.1 hypothetical protein [Planosporangium mesophilum]GII25630.1 hypothetical protein Pme01_52270 [Planosporangium mesophilum]